MPCAARQKKGDTHERPLGFLALQGIQRFPPQHAGRQAGVLAAGTLVPQGFCPTCPGPGARGRHRLELRCSASAPLAGGSVQCPAAGHGRYGLGRKTFQPERGFRHAVRSPICLARQGISASWQPSADARAGRLPAAHVPRIRCAAAGFVMYGRCPHGWPDGHGCPHGCPSP